MTYNLKNIFSSVQEAVLEKGHSPNSDFMISSNFLMNKSFSLAGCNNPDLYFLLDFQEQGKVIFEKNSGLSLGLDEPLVKNILPLIDKEHLECDAVMDQCFIEFHFEKKLKPLEVMLTSIDILYLEDGTKTYVKRCISVISNDSNEIPQFGFVSVNKIEKLPKNHSTKDFEIISTSNNEILQEELKNMIQEKLKAV